MDNTKTQKPLSGISCQKLDAIFRLRVYYGVIYDHNTKMYSITLLGDPKSTQNCYRYRCVGRQPRAYMKPDCQLLKVDYQNQLRRQWNHPPFTHELTMTLALYHGTRHVKDIDNYCKLLLDAMTGIVYVDDGQIVKLTISKAYDKTNPRAEITVD